MRASYKITLVVAEGALVGGTFEVYFRELYGQLFQSGVFKGAKTPKNVKKNFASLFWNLHVEERRST